MRLAVITRKDWFKVWAASWANLAHCGSYNFNGKLPRA